MGEFHDKLGDYISNHHLFADKKSPYLMDDKKRLIQYAIDYLLFPEWQKVRINNMLNDAMEIRITNDVVSATTQVLNEEIGLDCEMEIRDVISSNIHSWREKYNV